LYCFVIIGEEPENERGSRVSEAKILVIDDEQSILNLVTAYLRLEGYEIYTATDGPSGLQSALKLKPDIVILDVMLPGMDGMEVLSRLRRESEVYVIMLTARTEETDKIVGLSLGADDYVTKPFSPRELVARIKSTLRRMHLKRESVNGAEIIAFEKMRIDTGSRQVWVDEKEIELTAIEFDLLTAMAQHHGMVLTREQLLEKVWGYDYYGDSRVVDVHIGHVRQKIGMDRFIQTVRGVGYRFSEEAEQI
jgi:two-component system, OmpR family, alkaline phosphatase synthesis response regulator PhoP